MMRDVCNPLMDAMSAVPSEDENPPAKVRRRIIVFTSNLKVMGSNVQQSSDQECKLSVQLLSHLDECDRSVTALPCNLDSGPMTPNEDRDCRSGVVRDVEFSKNRRLKITVRNIPELRGSKTEPVLLPLERLSVMEHLVCRNPAMRVTHKFNTSGKVSKGRQRWRGSQVQVMPPCMDGM